MSQSIVMLGATGAVGTQVAKHLLAREELAQLTLLGRRPVEVLSSAVVHQYNADIFNAKSYSDHLAGHDTAICTLGVGQPSKMSKEDFLKIDKQAVIDFGAACKDAGIQHFQLLASVGIDSESSSFYLRAKGELVDTLKDMHFEQLTIYRPSMILTEQNRYGLLQGILLKVWPWLHVFLQGRLKKYRGVRVTDLGKAIADYSFVNDKGYKDLTWSDFQRFI